HRGTGDVLQAMQWPPELLDQDFLFIKHCVDGEYHRLRPIAEQYRRHELRRPGKATYLQHLREADQRNHAPAHTQGFTSLHRTHVLLPVAQGSLDIGDPQYVPAFGDFHHQAAEGRERHWQPDAKEGALAGPRLHTYPASEPLGI